MLKMEPKKAYLKPIKIGAGQFSNERSVCLLCHDGTETSGFVDNKYIKNKQLEIKVIKEQKNLALIKLPGRMLESREIRDILLLKNQTLNMLLKQVLNNRFLYLS